MISPCSNGLLLAVFHMMEFFFFDCCIFIAACRLSSCSAEASHCGGFSCWEAWALGPQASAAAACELSIEKTTLEARLVGF